MKYFNLTFLVITSSNMLLGCSGTGNFVDSPTFRNQNAVMSIEQSTIALFTDSKPPYTINFCDADIKTRECEDVDSNPSATGIGGLFLPLTMEFRSADVLSIDRLDNNLKMQATLNAPVNKIPSVCGTIDGEITYSESSARLHFPNTYCNWMVIGNVAQSATFSIDSINLDTKSFTGYYKIAFYGTGNANGSGYYRATITTSPTKNSGE